MPFLTSLSTRSIAFSGMALCMLIYGSNFVFSRHALLNGLTTHDMIALRFLVAGIMLLPIFLAANGWRDCAGIGWPRGILLACMSGVPLSYLMMTGLSLAPAAHGASIGPGTVTVIGVFGSALLFGARLTPQLVAGIAVVLCGLATLAYAGSQSAGPHVLLGDLFFLIMAGIWGWYPLLVSKWKLDALRATAVVCVLSMLYLPLYYVLFFNGFAGVSWLTLALHGFNQGVLNTVVGLWIWGWATKVLGGTVTGRFPPSMPVIGTVLAIPVLGELPTSLQWLGVALIVAGLVLAALRTPDRAPDDNQGDLRGGSSTTR